MAKARAAGSFLGGIANNPGIIIIALAIGALLIFRKPITEAFGSLGESITSGIGGIGTSITEGFAGLKFPELPDINFPEFPEITFPEFPDFTDLFSGFQSQLDLLFNNQQSILAGQTVAGQGEDQTIVIPPDTVVNPDGTVSSTTPPISMGAGATQQELTFAQTRANTFDILFGLGVSGTQAQQEISALPFGDITALNDLVTRFQTFFGQPEPAPLDSGLTPAQQFVNQNNQQGLVVPFNDPLGLGGGISFAGGTTTFGDANNIIDTLSEVLGIFPNLTASQAANALFANPNLTGNEFAAITPIQPSISSAGIDPEQIINNASGGFSGLTPEQIAFILTGGNIQNF